MEKFNSDTKSDKTQKEIAFSEKVFANNLPTISPTTARLIFYDKFSDLIDTKKIKSLTNNLQPSLIFVSNIIRGEVDTAALAAIVFDRVVQQWNSTL